MKSASGGFTIVEVLIVLAISSAMLVSAYGIFGSRRQAVDFTQAVYDLQSQIHSLANSVSSQAVPGVQQYVCSPAMVGTVMRPVLSSGSSTNQDCIYLGQAIQVVANSPNLTAYPVFGLRTVYNGATDTGVAPTTASDANPEPAINSSDPTNPANLLLINTYTMINGLKTVSAQYSGTENDILTLYSSLQDSNTSGNEITVTSTNYTGASTNPKAQIKACIEGLGVAGSSCPTSNPVANTPWKLCVTDGTHQAQINIRAIPTGIVTSLNMNGCG